MTDSEIKSDVEQFFVPGKPVGTLTVLKEIFLDKIGVTDYRSEVNIIRKRLEDISPAVSTPDNDTN